MSAIQVEQNNKEEKEKKIFQENIHNFEYNALHRKAFGRKTRLPLYTAVLWKKTRFTEPFKVLNFIRVQNPLKMVL